MISYKRLQLCFSRWSISLAPLMKKAAMLSNGLWKCPQGLWPTASNVETLSPTTHKELNPANNHGSLEADQSPVEPPDRTHPWLTP